MKSAFQKVSCAAAAVILFTLVGAPQANAQTIVADWTFNKDTTVDSVGGHNFQTSFGGGTVGYGSASIGGPSTNPAFFSDGGYYSVAAGTTTLPSTNYTLSLYTQVPTDDLNNSILFSTNGGSTNNVQIGIYDGDFVAYYNSNGNNFVSSTGDLSLTATLIGSFTATSADTHLSVTDIGGVYTFSDNGVNDTSVDIDNTTSFTKPHAGVAPGGGGPNFTGYMSDITVTAGVDSLPVPEPSTYVLMGLGLFGLVVLRRFYRSNA